MSIRNKTKKSEQSCQQSLIFGAVFTNGKRVPKRVEFLNILHKVQVVELRILIRSFLKPRYELLYLNQSF